MNKTFFVLIVLCLSSIAAAETPGGTPVTPIDAVWAGVLVFIILGLFLAAATIGPLVAILMPPAPEPVSHEEHDDDGHH